MADNGYTKTYVDGASLTEAQLDTAYKSVQPDITQLAQSTTGSTSGQVLTSAGSNVPPAYGDIPDPMGPSSLRNYGIDATVSSGALSITLKTNSGSDPTSNNPVNLTFSNNGTGSATYTEIDVTGATAITVPSSASLGFVGTSANRVYVYAANSSGTAVLAVSQLGTFDSGQAVAIDAISTSSDFPGKIYASASATLCVRLLGYVEAALNTSLQWTAPTRTAVINGVAGSVALSPECVAFNTTSSAAIAVGNLEVTIAATGSPIELRLISTNTSSLTTGVVSIDTNGSSAVKAEGILEFRRDSTVVSRCRFQTESGSASTTVGLVLPASTFSCIDMPPPGTYTYSVYAFTIDGLDSLRVTQVKLAALPR